MITGTLCPKCGKYIKVNWEGNDPEPEFCQCEKPIEIPLSNKELKFETNLKKDIKEILKNNYIEDSVELIYDLILGIIKHL